MVTAIQRMTAVQFARNQIGHPYQFKGVGPRAFDCSGLVVAAWHAAGVDLPHNAGQQALVLHAVPYTKQSKAMLQLGDLVLYYGSTKDPQSISHVGIYSAVKFGLKQIIAAVDEQYGVLEHGMFKFLAPCGFGYLR